MIKELEYPYAGTPVPRVSWGAVFAGAITSLACMTTFACLGAGFTATASPAGYAGPASWMLLSGIASFYAGGWIAGRLTGIGRVGDSVIHGLVAWASATVMLAFVFTAGTAGALGAAAAAIGSAPGGGAAAMTDLDRAMIESAAAAAGGFAFVMLVFDAAAAALGARAGARVLRPVPLPAARRESAVV